MQNKTNNQPNDHLWKARKRSNLAQKNVAFLLGHETIKNISEYENGRMPNLLTALKLEIIYKTPVRMLFYQVYSKAVWQVRDQIMKLKENASVHKVDISQLEKQMKHGDYCTYADLLKVPKLPPIEREKVREHLVYLANILNNTEEPMH